MFILKLGQEALSLKSGSLETKNKNIPTSVNNDASSKNLTLSDTNGHMLENLLNGCLVESALLSDDLQIKRCKSATNSSRSVFIQSSDSEKYRPRSDTAPQASFLREENRLSQFSNQIRKRKLHSTQSILYESLSNEFKSDKRALMISMNNGNGFNLLSGLDSSELSISEMQPYSTLSIDETKRLREQINLLLKRIMQIIKSNSNYSSISESRKFTLVSNLWYKLIVLLIIQMDAESCRFMFRWLLLSIFNGKEDSDCSRRDKIILLEKLQEISQSYFWLATNTEILHCVLFWFFSKYGYPDAFFMSPQALMCKLSDLILDKGRLDSVLRLIHELSEITEDHVRKLFCQHLPTESSMAEFLIQWT